MVNLYLGTINRSGGSLFCRLLDGHPDVASFPVEMAFPNNENIAPDLENITGIPRIVPKYDKKDDYYKLVGLSKNIITPVHKWGKESSDAIGVRKNYLEKEFYGKVKTDFDFETYIMTFERLCLKALSYKDIWNAKSKAYFNAWENNRYSGTMKYVVWHDSGGFYISNHKNYFQEFNESYWIYSLRNVLGYIASEKTRLARRFYGSRRFPKIKMPNHLVKIFNNYDLNSHIQSWMAAFTRIILFQEEYGINNKFLVYSYESLLKDTEKIMQLICRKTDLIYNPCLLNPTIAGKPWGGSSHQGKQSGINANLANYYSQVLTVEEIKIIRSICGPLIDFLESANSNLLDLTQIDKDVLKDYNYQKKYFHDEEKTALYSFVVNSPRRKYKIKAPTFHHLFAYLYSKVIRVIHIPRLLKLRLFPGIGKQNYT